MKLLAKYFYLKIETNIPREVLVKPARLKQSGSSNADNDLAIKEDTEEEEAIYYIEGARVHLSQLMDTHKKIQFTTETIKAVNKQLDDIQVDLLKALKVLPTSSVEPQAELTQLLKQLAIGREDIGNALLKESKKTKAIKSYKKALEIYTAPYFAKRNPLEEFRVNAHLISAYSKKQLYSKAISLAHKALKLHSHCAEEEESSAIVCEVYSNLILAYLHKKHYSKAMACGHMALEFYKDSKSASMHDKIKGYLIQVISAQAIDRISKPVQYPTTALKKLGTFATQTQDHGAQAPSESCLTLT